MGENRLEYITARLKAINKISYLLNSKEPSEIDFTSICRIFVETVGYNSCWIALTNDAGQIKDFTHFQRSGMFKFNSGGFPDSIFNNFATETLIQASDFILNRDPILEFINLENNEKDRKLNSLTMKFTHYNMIYGVISVTLNGDYNLIKEEVLIISELVKTISFFLYDIDFKNRLKYLFFTMFETTGSATTFIEEDTVISYANKEFEILSGYKKEEIEGRMSWKEFVHDADLKKMIRYHKLRRMGPGRAPRNYEFRFIDRDGQVKNIYMTVGMVPNSKMSIFSFRDVTEKKQLESQILKISEQERQQIANDLHDGLGPHLVGVRFMLKLIKKQVENRDMPDYSSIVEVENLVSQAIEHTRSITKGLKPVDIQSDGLFFALEELTGNVQKIFGIPCRLDYSESITISDNIAATHLYYIIQEAINNSVKHASPQKIHVRVRYEKNAVRVEVKDDGIGIPKILDSDKGLGISIMKYRASIINASLKISDNKPAGTRVVCVLKNTERQKNGASDEREAG